jgi:hypothetical protein
MNGIQNCQKSESIPSFDPLTGIEKRCVVCGSIKAIDGFYSQKGCKYGVQNQCKECVKNKATAYKAKNPLKVSLWAKAWRGRNKEQRNVYNKIWKRKNKDIFNERRRKDYLENKDKYREYASNWKILNPDKYKERVRRYSLAQRSTLSGILNKRMATAIRNSIIEDKCGRRWERMVGYTLLDLKSHIESKFKPGMSWDNIGDWHIDHKIPISAFNFQTPKDLDFKRCWALSNLQPLPAIENIIKHNRVERPFQPSLNISI